MPSPVAHLRAMLCAALFPVISVVLGKSLYSQTTYTSFDFTLVRAAAGISGGLAADGNGNLFVVDGSTIRKINAGGVVTTLAGTEGVQGSADGTGAAAQFNGASALAVDADENVYVADTMNMTIRKVTAAGVVTTLAGTAGGIPAFSDGAGSAARFWGPKSVAVDAAGTLYVADYGFLRRITPDGVVTTLGNPEVSGAGGVAVDGKGNVFIACTTSNAIVEMAADGSFRTLAGNTLGSADGTGSAAQFWWPSALAADGNGNVFVADTWNDTIRRVTAGGVVTTIAGIPGAAGSAAGVGPAARFNRPASLAVDKSGNVYASDAASSPSNGIQVGQFSPQAQATVTLGNLYQVYDGTAKNVSEATNPAGLATFVTYSPGGFSAPTAVGSYSVWATVLDPNYTGSGYGTLIIRPGSSNRPSFAMRNTRMGGNTLRGIAAGPGGLVAVGDGGTILTSTDGVTWTPRDSGTTVSLCGVTFGEGHFVTVGDNGCVLLSSNGATWSSVLQTATTARLNNVLFADGQFVAVGEGGTIINSPDGINWTARNSGFTGWLRGLTHTNNATSTNDSRYGPTTDTIPTRFVAAGQGGAIILSSDGDTWTSEFDTENGPQDSTENIGALADDDSNSYFVGLGASGALLRNYMCAGSGPGFDVGVSIDTTLEPCYPGVVFSGLIKGAGTLFVTGASGLIITTSGGSWWQVASGTTSDLVCGVAIGNSVFIAGGNETILQSTQPPDSRLVNLSCRAQVGTGSNMLIAGFVTGGLGTSGSEPLLIRASGPALAPFGVAGTLPDPNLQLFSISSGSKMVASNNAWGGASAISGAAAALGAFAWSNSSSHDSALLETLGPGTYTANVFGSSGDGGVALAEVYDATLDATATSASPRLVNLSARSVAGAGGNGLIAGFVIGGSIPKTVLIRASGPALVPFGVSGTLPDPELQVYSTASGNSLVASNIGWGGDAQIATAAGWVGAFSWGSSATPDSALLLTLPPGPYTANVTGASGDSGVALVELYEVQ